MLGLGRKRNETVLIGQTGDVLLGPIEVTIVRCSANGVRLGISASTNIRIVRNELIEDRDQPGTSKCIASP
jgi:carbon storage regulator CsrA